MRLRNQLLLRHVFLIAACALAVLHGAPAWAQSPSAVSGSQLAPAELAAEPAPGGQPAETAPPVYPPSLDDHCNPNFWIVSSRRCPQDDDCGAIHCDFDYYHSPGENCLLPSSRHAFLASLQPGVPVCVVIHGSFVEAEGVYAESLATYRWLRRVAPHQPLHVVFYTWPSEFPETLIVPLDIAILGRRAGFNGHYVARLIAQIPAANPVSLIGHSHGSRVAASAMHLLGGGLVDGRPYHGPLPQPNRIRVVLAAAAIDHHWLNPGERYGNALCRAECLVNLRNDRDFPLLFYPLRKPFGHRSLAHAGFTDKDRRRLGWLNAKVAELDVQYVVGAGHIWPNYYERPEIAYAIAPYVYFMNP